MDYMDEPCTIEIKRDLAILSWPGGKRMAFPIDVFRQQYITAGNAIMDYDARASGQVVPIRRR